MYIIFIHIITHSVVIISIYIYIYIYIYIHIHIHNIHNVHIIYTNTVCYQCASIDNDDYYYKIGSIHMHDSCQYIVK